MRVTPVAAQELSEIALPPNGMDQKGRDFAVDRARESDDCLSEEGDRGVENWQTAAQFCADHKINLEEALVWADKAISEPFRNAAQGREDFSTLSTKAAVLRAMGRAVDADAVMEKAVKMADAPVAGIHQALKEKAR